MFSIVSPVLKRSVLMVCEIRKDFFVGNTQPVLSGMITTYTRPLIFVALETIVST